MSTTKLEYCEKFEFIYVITDTIKVSVAFSNSLAWELLAERINTKYGA